MKSIDSYFAYVIDLSSQLNNGGKSSEAKKKFQEIFVSIFRNEGCKTSVFCNKAFEDLKSNNRSFNLKFVCDYLGALKLAYMEPQSIINHKYWKRPANHAYMTPEKFKKRLYLESMEMMEKIHFALLQMKKTHPSLLDYSEKSLCIPLAQ